MSWRFFPGEHFAAIQEERKASISLLHWQEIAELHNVGSVDDVKKRGYLMAAGPDLYVALEQVWNLEAQDHWPEQLTQNVQTALKKARGES